MTRACVCNCGRTFPALNPRRRWHPECDGRSIVKRAYTRHVVEPAEQVEALWAAARAARLAGRMR